MSSSWHERIYSDEGSFNYIIYIRALSASVSPLLKQRTFCPESHVCLSPEYLSTYWKRRNVKNAQIWEGGCHGNPFACQPGCPATRASGSIQEAILWPLHTGTLPQAFRWVLLEGFCQGGSPDSAPTLVRPTDYQGELEVMGRDLTLR